MAPRRTTTPDLAAWIKAIHRDSPDLHQYQIAALVGCNQGRVCEVLTGQRYPEIEPGYPASLGFMEGED